MSLGQRIHQLRKRRGYSQDELADKVGIQRSYIGHIERGTREPSREIIVALARALETTAEDLLEAAGYLKPKRPLTDESQETQFDGYANLSPAKRRLAKKMIDDIIRNLEQADIDE